MRNLLERMKPEPLAKLNEALEEYPETLKVIKEDLETHYFVTDLRYGNILYLSFFDIIDNLNISTVKTLFND